MNNAQDVSNAIIDLITPEIADGLSVTAALAGVARVLGVVSAACADGGIDRVNIDMIIAGSASAGQRLFGVERGMPEAIQ